MLNRSRGIVFLGTPHKGSGVAEHATLLGNILGAVWSPASFIVPGPRNKLVSDLERNSEILFGIADRFAGRTKFIKIASFYETDQTLLVRNVVRANEHWMIFRIDIYRWSTRILACSGWRTRDDGPCMEITAIFVASTTMIQGTTKLSLLPFARWPRVYLRHVKARSQNGVGSSNTGSLPP